MRVLIAAALLFAAVAVTSFAGPVTGDREHILGTDADTSAKREHIL
ncbi:hypothetical protein [Lentzea sp. NEAU-D7]|nr:hypothetical protein [Lentzea sp. NEAU-D7]MCX2954430.1 hypothetical protein [Lentzea sp. NEAU-D7]